MPQEIITPLTVENMIHEVHEDVCFPGKLDVILHPDWCSVDYHDEAYEKFGYAFEEYT